MDYPYIIGISLLVFVIIYANILGIEKTRTTYKLSKYRKKLEKIITTDIYDKTESRVKYSQVKESIIYQLKRVSLNLAKMRYLYKSNKAVNDFYEAQIKKLKTLNKEVDECLLILSEANEGRDYNLDQVAKKDFDNINNKINSFVTQYLLTNASLINELNTTRKNVKNEKDLIKQIRLSRIIKSVLSVIISILISLAANYIGQFIF